MLGKIYIVGGGWATKGFLDTIDFDLYDIHVLSNNENFVYWNSSIFSNCA